MRSGARIGLRGWLAALLVAGCGGASDPPPIVLSADAYSPERVVVSWAYTTGDHYARYFLYRDDVEIAVYSYSFQSMHDIARTPGASHCYRMRASFYTGTITDMFLPPGVPDLHSNTVCVTTPTVEPWTGTAGLAPDADLAVDADGFLHLAWATTTDAAYGTDRSGTWVAETLGLANPPDGEVAVAVDSAGAAHVAWVRQANPAGVEYATNATGAWGTGTIHAGGSYVAAVDIAVDAGDMPHILFRENTLRETHASGGPGAWTLNGFTDPGGQIPGGGLGVRQLKIAVAPDGTVHFVRRDGNSLNHADSNGYAWSTRIGVTWGIGLDFVMAPDGTPWVAEWDEAVPPRLTLTTPNGNWPATWLHTAAEGVTVGDVALAIGADGARHLLFVDDGHLVYGQAGGRFTRRFIDSGAITGPRLAEGPAGLHAAYTDAAVPEGVYATLP